MTSVTFTATATDSHTGAFGSKSASFNVNSQVAQLIGARPSGPALTDFTSSNATIGPLKSMRIFFSGALPATIVNTVPGKLPAGVTPIVSYKTMTTNVASFVDSVTSPLWLCYHHEPEGDYSAGSDFVSEFVAQSALIKSRGNPNVSVFMAGGGYQYTPGQFGANGAFLPPASSVDFYTLDCYQYQQGTGPNVWPSQGLANYPRWLNWLSLVQPKGKPLGITEYGIDQDNPNAATANAVRNTRLQTDAVYLRNTFNGSFAHLGYWWMNSTPDVPTTNNQFTDTATINTWKAIEAGTI